MTTNIGIGFVTGRKLFKNVLKTYINNWLEHGLIENQRVRLHLFVAYDLKYQKTQISDYKDIPPELADMVESIHFYSEEKIKAEIALIAAENILSVEDAQLLFGDGYGRKRNVVTYFAIKNKMDKLLFIDDDEYPTAATLAGNNKLVWMGQSILGTHLQYNDDAAITHGHHCGYISPIPYIRFDESLPESDFKLFVEAISNDIISWEKIRQLTLNNKGVTYASPAILHEQQQAYEVPEENGMKFISGANLCFNLKHYKNLPPFYNPPGARGEDTFMSTALSSVKLTKVPCYTFHDGFSMYNNILHGVLPTYLGPVEGSSAVVRKRFLNAAIGWIRYKPLLVFITNPDDYEHIMEDIQKKLDHTLPILSAYFGLNDFRKISHEFNRYRRNVKKHFEEFEKTKAAWKELMNRVHAIPDGDGPSVLQMKGPGDQQVELLSN